MFNKITKSNILIYCGLFLLAFLVVFVSALNPFSSAELESDTTIYLTIAQGITRGQVPYKDFADNKGPLTYLISVPGMFFGGFTGVWITELILMFISVLFAYKTALFFGNNIFSLSGVVCSFLVFQSFLDEVAGTEEYALPFMMISLYIFTKYFFTKKEPPVFELIIVGICFAAAFLIRINMFPLWLGFCIIILIETLYNKKFLPLIKFVSFFCIGILIVIIPLYLYLYCNNAFSDYIHQNFIVGSSRGLSGFSIKEFVISFYKIIDKNYCWLPLPIYFIWIIKKQEKINVFLSAGLLLAYLLTVLFLAVILTSFRHYNLVLTPFLVPVFTFCSMPVYNYFSNVKNKKIALLVFVCIIFSQCFATWCWSVYNNMTDSSRNKSISMGKRIDQNTTMDDRIILLGKPYHIYLFTERLAASRYIYQGSGVNYDPNAQTEFLLDMQKNRPKIIGIAEINGNYNHLPGWYSPVYTMIENEYRILSSDNGYFLFIRDK